MATIDQQKITEAIQYQDTHDAVAILAYFKKHPDEQLDPAVQLQLEYIRLNSLNTAQVIHLLSTSVLAAYSIPDFLLSEKIETYSELIEDINEEIEFYEKLIKLLDSHPEALGTAKIKVNGATVEPTIGNWLKDYLSSPGDNGARNALTEVKYFSTSPNVKLVPENFQAVIKDLIKLYDSVQERLIEWNSIPEPKTEDETKKLLEGYDLYQTFPELAEDSGTTEYNKPKEAPQIVAQKQQRVASDFKIPIAKDLDLKTLPKRGLSFSQGTNVDVSNAVEENKQQEIEAKLEELKKRKQG